MTMVDANKNIERCDAYFAQLRQLNWDDISSVHTACEPVLRAIGNDIGIMDYLMDRMMSRADLAAKAERFDYITQMVLEDQIDKGFRLRLHIYGEKQHDWPHNHRWPLANLTLFGGIEQSCYDPAVINMLDEDITGLSPHVYTQRTVGDFYALHEDMVDCVTGPPGAIALLVRGPATRDNFVMFDRAENRVWSRKGRAKETEAELAAKFMSSKQIKEACDYVSRTLRNISNA